MCTAATYYPQNHYFGRNLDFEFSYDETVTVTPRNFPFHFCQMGDLNHHYAIIGMAYVANGYPLYYDAMNEKGLGMGGLMFANNADYKPQAAGKDNVSPYEFIPWILSQCATVDEAKALLARINLVNIPFSDELPLSELHWMIADKNSSIVVESMKDGLHVYDNPVGVLTNNPPFPQQLFGLNNYRHLSVDQPADTFSASLPLDLYSRGMGGIGLPGDLSSASRFTKVAFTRLNSKSGTSEAEGVSQFFHILGAGEQQRGLTHITDDKYEITLYSSCSSLDTGIYYYTTYENRQISAVDMTKENLDAAALVSYPLIDTQQIKYQN